MSLDVFACTCDNLPLTEDLGSGDRLGPIHLVLRGVQSHLSRVGKELDSLHNVTRSYLKWAVRES